MKKQLRKAMICTIAMMLVAVITLTGVTYAWFSKSDYASVNGLEMNVIEADGGVFISDNITGPYTSNLDLSVSSDVLYTSVSSAGDLDNLGKLKFFEGIIANPESTALTTKKVDDAGNYYVEQDIYFNNAKGTTNVEVSLDGSQIIPTPVDGVTKRVNLATRVAVVTHGSITKADFDAGKVPTNNTNSDYVQIWETNPLDHTPEGQIEYTNFYMEDNPEYDPDDPDNNEPEHLPAPMQGNYDYYAVNDTTWEQKKDDEGNPVTENGQPVLENKPIERGSTTVTKLTNMVKKATSNGDKILKRNAKDVRITVPAGSYLKITLYIWIEGQDADCQNDVSGNSFRAKIRFTKVGSSAEMVTCPNGDCGNMFAISDVVTKETEQEVGGETTTVTTKHCPKCDAEMPKVTCTNTECAKTYYRIDAKTKDGKKVCPYCETEMPAEAS